MADDSKSEQRSKKTATEAPPKTPPVKLAPKQQRFIDEYLIDLNASAAARRAGYSPRSAAKYGQNLMAKKHIREAISRAKSERSKRTQITQDMVLRRLAQLFDTDLLDLCFTDGRLKPLGDMSEGGRYLLRGMKVEEYVLEDGGDGTPVRKIDFSVHGREKALELAMRHLGILQDKLQIDGLKGLAEAIAAGRRRARG